MLFVAPKQRNVPYYPPDNLVQSGSIALATNITIASTTMTTILTLSPTTYGGRLIIRAFITSSNSAAANIANLFQIQLDGTTVADGGSGLDGGALSTGQEPINTAMSSGVITPVAGGPHTITLQWSTAGNTARINAASKTNGESAVLEFQEVYV